MLSPYLPIRALAEMAEFVPLPNDEISDEILRFASVQSNSIVKKGVANPWFIGPWHEVNENFEMFY